MILFTDLNLDKFYFDDFDDLLGFLLENGTITMHDIVIAELDRELNRYFVRQNDDTIGFYTKVEIPTKKIDENLCVPQLNTILQSLNIEEIK